MSALKIEMVLTGPLAGKSLLINRHSFKNGVAHIVVEPQAMDAFLTFMARSCQAYPRGSEALAIAQQRDSANGVLSGVQADSASSDGASASVQGAGERDASGQVPDPRTLQRDEHAGSEAGSEGLVSSGAGHSNAGLGDGVVTGSHVEPDAIITRVANAVAKLDPAVDEHWTSEGLPSVSVVADTVGDQKVTREMIDEAAPEFNRQRAEDAKL